jgi:hypothetical protein
MMDGTSISDTQKVTQVSPQQTNLAGFPELTTTSLV